ncbi:hypothetical protein Taro_038229, partial [Colocasia esculenta]|nr:hypothetical protein [Colocasia esculenta]
MLASSPPKARGNRGSPKVLDQLGLEAKLEGLRATVEAFIKPGHDGLEYDNFESLYRSLGDAFFEGIRVGEGVGDLDATKSDLEGVFKWSTRK